MMKKTLSSLVIGLALFQTQAGQGATDQQVVIRPYTNKQNNTAFVEKITTPSRKSVGTVALSTEAGYVDSGFSVGGGKISVGNISTPRARNNVATNQPSNPQLSATPESSEIAQLLFDNRSHLEWQGVNNRLRSMTDIRQLYSQMNYRPLWSHNGQVTPLAISVIKATQDAWEDALRPEVYHTKATAALRAGQQIADPAKFDIILSDAFITYKKHLANGIVNPKKQFSSWNQKPESLNFASLYRKAEEKGSAKSILTIYDPDYQTLKKAYVAAIGKAPQASNDNAQKAQIPSKTLALGAKGPAVVALRHRLGLSTDSDVYDKTVKQAVKDYQKDFGLGADGVAGRKTIAHMNGKSTKSGKGNPQKLALNMERMRWQNDTPTGNYVWVNIPAYKMAIRNGKDFIFKSNVIVGRTKRKTPIFKDTLEHIVLAPYWNVPKTIFKEDKLPKLQRNPNALGKNMQVVNTATGKVVNSSSVNWKDGGKGYRLRQLPGPRNSLGHMKFLFPNSHAIYLHDTPNRKLFKKSKRALSSGCVRVERAEDLAVFLLKDEGYNRSRIKKDSRKKKEKWVNLHGQQRYPVYLNYYTAWVDGNGKVRYSNDVYGYDKPLRSMYNSALKNI